jgi:hypothetical protein
MLTKVFSPGTHDECFEIAICDFKVAANSPSRRPVAASDASVLVHGFDELWHLLGINVVFNRDEYRTASSASVSTTAGRRQ